MGDPPQAVGAFSTTCIISQQSNVPTQVKLNAHCACVCDRTSVCACNKTGIYTIHVRVCVCV